MPQGRRKTPFSGKAKREQLKSKKQSKLGSKVQDSDEENSDCVTKKIHYQPSKGPRTNSNRYALQFFKESDDEIRHRKEEASHSLENISEKQLEVDGKYFFPKELDFPKRPPWSFNLSKEELNAKENSYFTKFIQSLQEKFHRKELSFFELNLETWRQLWRVLEMSDIMLFIVDIRFSALMFPPSVYDYVSNVLRKEIILVLNKIDLAPAPLVAAWKNYFTENFPHLHIIMFTSVPGYNLIGKSSDKGGLQIRRRRGKIRMAAEGTQMLFETCKTIVGEAVDLTSWQQKIKEETKLDINDDEDEKVEVGETINLQKTDTSYYEHVKYKNGVLTIGCVGQPNVGKSSLMNAIIGKKVVSVSKTPGHTKHFQTIFLTPNVRLCDCPGLVFPSKVPKPLQVLMGSLPIAQLREPYSSVKYLAERLDLPKLLRINHPENDDTWSAMDVCDGWAKKRGFLTAKAARLDTYRAANNLLRMALDGKICLCLRPVGYTDKKEFWASHPDIQTIKWIQSRAQENAVAEGGADLSHSDYSDEEIVPPKGQKSNNSSDSDDEIETDEGKQSEDDPDSDVLYVKQNQFAMLQDL